MHPSAASKNTVGCGSVQVGGVPLLEPLTSKAVIDPTATCTVIDTGRWVVAAAPASKHMLALGESILHAVGAAPAREGSIDSLRRDGVAQQE